MAEMLARASRAWILVDQHIQGSISRAGEVVMPHWLHHQKVCVFSNTKIAFLIPTAYL